MKLRQTIKAANKVRKSEGTVGFVFAGVIFFGTLVSRLLWRLGIRSPIRRVHRTEFGFMMNVDYRHYLEAKTRFGLFERGLVDRLVALRADGSVRFADVGANFGFYSLLFAAHGDGDVRVDAFEPISLNRERLRRNVELNDFGETIAVNDVALMDFTGTSEMALNESALGEATFGDEMWSASAATTVAVDVDRLDDVFDGTPAPDVIKVDVEGAEVDVLRGGRELLATNRPDLLIETHEELMESFGTSRGDLGRLLASVGYERLYDAENAVTLPVDRLVHAPEQVGRHIHILGNET